MTREVDRESAEGRRDDDGKHRGGQDDTAAPQTHRERDRAERGLHSGFRDISDRAEKALFESKGSLDQGKENAAHAEKK